MYLHDLNLVHDKTTTDDAYMVFNTVCSSSRIVNNGYFILMTMNYCHIGHVITCACSDGNIRIFDAKLRSPNIIGSIKHIIHLLIVQSATIEGHIGSITDVSMNPKDWRVKLILYPLIYKLLQTIITCGTTKKAINPYDPNRCEMIILEMITINIFSVHFTLVMIPSFESSTLGCIDN